jgi:hypothetical protein
MLLRLDALEPPEDSNKGQNLTMDVSAQHFLLQEWNPQL